VSGAVPAIVKGQSQRDGHPTRRHILDVLEGVEVALSAVMRRWDGGIPAEVRVEIMMDAYEPVLCLLLRAGRRGLIQRGVPLAARDRPSTIGRGSGSGRPAYPQLPVAGERDELA
jgi:hypothetical protein